MDTQTYLEILSRGVDVWNSWRENHRHIRPDLTASSLSEAKLKKVDFSGVDLTGVDFWGADLSEASLDAADAEVGVSLFG